MPLVPAKCTNCGGNLEVDTAHDAAICTFCKAPFVIEKAINEFEIRAGVLVGYHGESSILKLNRERFAQE